MKIFFDTEFTGLHQNTTLISIGLITENDREFYAECIDYNKNQIDKWIQQNVIDKLSFTASIDLEKEVQVFTEGACVSLVGITSEVAIKLENWLSEFDDVQMVSDCLSYDWVLFCQLWGHAFNIPNNVSPSPRDINQDIADYLGIDEKSAFDIDREIFANMLKTSEMKHDALWDAKVIKACYRRLNRRDL